MLKLNYFDQDGKEKTITKVSHGIKDMKRTLNYSKNIAAIYDNDEMSVDIGEGNRIKTPAFMLKELEFASNYLLEIFAENGLTQEILDDEIGVSFNALFDSVNSIQRQIMGGEENDDEKKQAETTLLTKP
ncbi:MAG: hypothetical protein RR494_02605 [Vagococcus sp.]|uniref:hypothetical protein n=1 Tax=Vagococcus sp. TaxID=1933889 RepID=UPI002FC5F006